MFISVDLPEPDGPTMATMTPRCSVRSMSFKTSTCRSPTAWVLQTPLSFRIGLSTGWPSYPPLSAVTTSSPSFRPSSTCTLTLSLMPIATIRVVASPSRRSTRTG